METADREIAKAMGSLDGMARAHIPEGLDAKIMARIAALPKLRIIPIPQRTVWLAAAGLMLLISTNLYVLSNKPANEAVAKHGDRNPIEAEYFQSAPSI